MAAAESSGQAVMAKLATKVKSLSDRAVILHETVDYKEDKYKEEIAAYQDDLNLKVQLAMDHTRDEVHQLFQSYKALSLQFKQATAVLQANMNILVQQTNNKLLNPAETEMVNQRVMELNGEYSQLVSEMLTRVHFSVHKTAIVKEVEKMLDDGFSAFYVKTAQLLPLDVTLRVMTDKCTCAVGSVVSFELLYRMDSKVEEVWEVEVKDENGELCFVRKIPAEATPHNSMRSEESKTYAFTPLTVGKVHITVKLYGEHVRGSPICIRVDSGKRTHATMPPVNIVSNEMMQIVNASRPLSSAEIRQQNGMPRALRFRQPSGIAPQFPASPTAPTPDISSEPETIDGKLNLTLSQASARRRFSPDLNISSISLNENNNPAVRENMTMPLPPSLNACDMERVRTNGAPPSEMLVEYAPRRQNTVVYSVEDEEIQNIAGFHVTDVDDLDFDIHLQCEDTHLMAELLNQGHELQPTPAPTREIYPAPHIQQVEFAYDRDQMINLGQAPAPGAIVEFEPAENQAPSPLIPADSEKPFLKSMLDQANNKLCGRLVLSIGGNREQELNQPIGVVRCPNSHIFVVCDTMNNAIKNFDENGGGPLMTQNASFEGRLLKPSAILLLPQEPGEDERKIVVKDNSALHVYGIKSLKPLRKFGRFNRARGLAWDSKGLLWTVDNQIGYELVAIDPVTGIENRRIAYDIPATPGAIANPCFLDILTGRDYSDVMVVSDLGVNKLFGIGLAAGQVLGVMGTGKSAQVGNFNFPAGVDHSGEDFIIAADAKNHRIQVLERSGKSVCVIKFSPPGCGFVSSILLTEDGHLLAINKPNGIINMFKLEPDID